MLGRAGLRARAALHLRAASTAPRDEQPAGSAYEVLGVGRSIDNESLRIVYKELAREWHPDRHQGEAAKDEAQRRFQDISEAFQTLSNENRRAVYDAALDAATSGSERQQVARRYRATSWSSSGPDMASRLRKARREEPGLPPHVLVGSLLLLTANFVLAFQWLAG